MARIFGILETLESSIVERNDTTFEKFNPFCHMLEPSVLRHVRTPLGNIQVSLEGQI